MTLVDENTALILERIVKEGATPHIDVNGNNIVLIPEGMKLETIYKADKWKAFKKKADIAITSALVTLVLCLAAGTYIVYFEAVCTWR